MTRLELLLGGRETARVGGDRCVSVARTLVRHACIHEELRHAIGLRRLLEIARCCGIVTHLRQHSRGALRMWYAIIHTNIHT